MTRRPRRNHSAAFKAKVALAAIQGDKNLSQLAEDFEIHTNQIIEWLHTRSGNYWTLFTPLISKLLDAVLHMGTKLAPSSAEWVQLFSASVPPVCHVWKST